MALTLEVKNPNLPDGAEIGIDGLGVVINGTTTEFSDDEVENFKLKNAVYTYDFSPTGVVTQVKVPRVATLIKNAPFVKIIKSDPNSDVEGNENA